MKLLVGVVAMICLAGCALSEEVRSKRRLVHSLSDPELERDSNGSEDKTSSSTNESTELGATPTSLERRHAGLEHDPRALAEENANANADAERRDSDTDAGTSRSTPTPQRRLRNKKGSSRRSNSKTSEEKTNREDNGVKHKSNTSRGSKKKIISNSKLLTKLGLARVEPGNKNHYRKRLAGSSQSQKNELIGNNYKGHQKRILENLDSRMYVIKLPPSSYYYASHHDLDKYRLGDPGYKHNLNNLGINFNSNGKPSKVYHYNIPIINKVVGRKTNSNFYKYDDDINDPLFLGSGAGESSIYNVQNLENHSSSELGLPATPELEPVKSYKKPYGPKKTVTYLKPKPAKQTFTKYFPSNGKPHGFYIIENSSTPYYHRLLP